MVIKQRVLNIRKLFARKPAVVRVNKTLIEYPRYLENGGEALADQTNQSRTTDARRLSRRRDIFGYVQKIKSKSVGTSEDRRCESRDPPGPGPSESQ